MKPNTLIIICIVVLGIGLFLSTIYDKKVNAYEIAMYQCKNNSSIPFPIEYLKPDSKKNFNPKKSTYQNFKLYWNNIGLTDLPNDFFEDYPCIKYLNVSKNHFTKIPTAIGDLTNLQMLFLQKNKIVSVKNDSINFKAFKDL